MPSSAEPQTIKRRFIDHLMVEKTSGNLRSYVFNQRTLGVPWRKIAIRVTDITGEDLTEMSLQNWFRNDEEIQAAKAEANAS